jgi:hypothetical protein
MLNLSSVLFPKWLGLQNTTSSFYIDPSDSDAISDLKAVLQKFAPCLKVDTTTGAVSLDEENIKLIQEYKEAKEKRKDKVLEELKQEYNKHVGVWLLKKLTSDPENRYFYGTRGPFNLRANPKGDPQYVLDQYFQEFKIPDDRTVVQEFFINSSITEYGKDGSEVVQYPPYPKEGFQGQVIIAPGQVYSAYRPIKIIKNDAGFETHQKGDWEPFPVARGSIVFHELAENYFRTHDKLSYRDAHHKAYILEKLTYNNHNVTEVTYKENGEIKEDNRGIIKFIFK